MSLRNQPYFPLYVQDFLTDEKLIECSAEATGVYIRLLCVLHKSEEYGKILLKQKDKQTPEQVKNFAIKLLKQMPYQIETITKSLQELINEGVIVLEDDILYQKRMVRDNEISIKRAESGKKGGDKTWFANKFAKAKVIANTENENEYEIENEDKKKKLIREYTEDFLKFWELYPNKKEKSFAFKCWGKIKNKPAIEVILNSIKKQIEWRDKANGEFRPEWKNPATWLNKGCWNDELKTGGNNGNQRGQANSYRGNYNNQKSTAGEEFDRIAERWKAKQETPVRDPE